MDYPFARIFCLPKRHVEAGSLFEQIVKNPWSHTANKQILKYKKRRTLAHGECPSLDLLASNTSQTKLPAIPEDRNRLGREVLDGVEDALCATENGANEALNAVEDCLEDCEYRFHFGLPFCCSPGSCCLTGMTQVWLITPLDCNPATKKSIIFEHCSVRVI